MAIPQKHFVGEAPTHFSSTTRCSNVHTPACGIQSSASWSYVLTSMDSRNRKRTKPKWDNPNGHEMRNTARSLEILRAVSIDSPRSPTRHFSSPELPSCSLQRGSFSRESGIPMNDPRLIKPWLFTGGWRRVINPTSFKRNTRRMALPVPNVFSFSTSQVPAGWLLPLAPWGVMLKSICVGW